MPKGKSLTDEERKEIYEARLLGESREEIARAYGIATASVTAIVRRYREKESSMSRECIVAGNKKTGRLISTADPRRYEGTYVIGGKSNSKTFMADNANIAARMWREWCDELRKKLTATPQPKPAPEPKKEEPKVQETKQATGNSVYIIWTKDENPKLFGAYLSMESALAEVDRLNDVASFLVSEKVFDVEEVNLRA